MGKTITKKQVMEKEEFFIKEIKSGKIFIYPTDTIYGIGCDATNNKSVKKIREIKQRELKSFSVISPSKEWIKDSCILNKKAEEWLKKLPGPYTLILKLKNSKAIAKEVTATETLGVRVPNNWFSDIIKKAIIPFVTTSVNISGQPHITKIQELNQKIKTQVDYIIEDGILNNKPSTIINLSNNDERIIR